jgi:membrane protease YdiL (CAAX protease family)
MATADVTQDHVTEQLSIPKVILLSLLPGAMVVIFDLLAAPVVESLRLPPLFTLFLGNALFIALFEFGYMLFQGRKLNGKLSLKGVVLYREPLPWWQYIVLVVVLLVWGLGVGTVMAPLSASLREGAFAWMPSVFTTDPAALDPGQYSQGALAATVVVGLVFTGIAIPIAEEFYYRGFLMPRMSRLGWLAPVVNVLLWGLNHFFEPWNIVLFILIFLPVGFVVWWKKNVYVSTAAHIIANLMAVLPMAAWLAGGAA